MAPQVKRTPHLERQKRIYWHPKPCYSGRKAEVWRAFMELSFRVSSSWKTVSGQFLSRHFLVMTSQHSHARELPIVTYIFTATEAEGPFSLSLKHLPSPPQSARNTPRQMKHMFRFRWRMKDKFYRHPCVSLLPTGREHPHPENIKTEKVWVHSHIQHTRATYWKLEPIFERK